MLKYAGHFIHPGYRIKTIAFPREKLILYRHMQNAVSIIIPVLNEGKTIGTIIQRVGKNPLVKEMIVFDMDNTILNGAFVDECAKKFAFEDKLMALRASDQEHYILTKNIAKLLQGINVAQLLETIDKIPFVKAVTNTIERLEKTRLYHRDYHSQLRLHSESRKK